MMKPHTTLVETSTQQLSSVSLDEVWGGADQPLYAQLTRTPGILPTYGHSYASMSDPLSTSDFVRNDGLLQRFNAPTRDALYNGGNDPRATSGVVSQPLGGIANVGPVPTDWGGNVTLEHGQGWVRNTTDYLHPLEGQITRHLVYDANSDRTSVLTVGNGEGGFETSRAAAAATMGPAAGLGLLDPQRIGHAANPFLGFERFGAMNNSMRFADGSSSSPTAPPSNFFSMNGLSERLSLASSIGKDTLALTQALANSPDGRAGTMEFGRTTTDQLMSDVTKHLSSNNDVNGFFRIEKGGEAISRIGDNGNYDTFVRNAEGKIEQLPSEPLLSYGPGDAAAYNTYKYPQAETATPAAAAAAAPAATPDVVGWGDPQNQFANGNQDFTAAQENGFSPEQMNGVDLGNNGFGGGAQNFTAAQENGFSPEQMNGVDLNNNGFGGGGGGGGGGDQNFTAAQENGFSPEQMNGVDLSSGNSGGFSDASASDPGMADF